MKEVKKFDHQEMNAELTAERVNRINEWLDEQNLSYKGNTKRIIISDLTVM